MFSPGGIGVIASGVGTKTLLIKVWGGAGGGATSAGTSGGGGYAEGTLLNVPSGTQFTVVVGRGGIESLGTGRGTQQYGGGGTSGASDWGCGGGLGGLFSGTGAITFDGTGQARAIIIAGGGGSPQDAQNGGVGGGTSGGDGTATGTNTAGLGGDQSSGGTGINAGSALKGGDGGGSGGGAGYHGGGSSDNVSGSTNRGSSGGGSGYVGGDGSWTPSSTTLTAATGATPPNTGDSDYPSGAGQGSASAVEGGAAAVLVYVNGTLHTTFAYTGADQTFTTP